ncbi:MAG: type II toxin-antitoxin system Phd/YefM family antitoxin [Actinomycetota bacterium]
MTVGVRELRQRAAEIIDAVREGEVVTVTYRGKPVARINPIRSRSEASDALGGAFGMWKDRRDMEDVRGWVREIRRPKGLRSSSTRTS